MKSFVFITYFLFLCLLSGNGQNKTLVLYNKNTGHTKTIQERRNIEIVCKDSIDIFRHNHKIKRVNKMVKGKLRIINDSCLIVRNDTLKISNILEIRIKPNATLIIGDGLICGTIAGGLVLLSFPLHEAAYVVGILYLGVGGVTTGIGIALASNRIKYKVSDWELSIKQ
jgi:hypothetical protein